MREPLAEVRMTDTTEFQLLAFFAGVLGGEGAGKEGLT